MLSRISAVILALGVAACGGSSPTAPTNFIVTVTSPDDTLYFGATEQMTATASDGRSLTGTWASDDPSVATVSQTGLVTPVSGGAADITFIASTGQHALKSFLALPNFAGTFTGSYDVTSCVSTNQFIVTEMPCGEISLGTPYPFTFQLQQSGQAVTGRFFLGSVEYDNVTGTVVIDGSLGFQGVGKTPDVVTQVEWNLEIPRPNATISGGLTEIWVDLGNGAQAKILGTISSINKTASVTQRALLPASR